MDQLASQGNTLILLPGWFSSGSSGAGTVSSYKTYLDKAQSLGIKVIVSLTGSSIGVPGITSSQTVTAVNALKNHPALYAWYIGDEPEMNAGSRTEAHTKLASNPGYYNIIKQADPSHPIMISFDRVAHDSEALLFYDVLDLVGTHAYPFNNYGDQREFVWYGGYETNREPYDDWKKDLDIVKARGKIGFVATAQGIGNKSDYREPTLNELRYQVFTAIVLGADKVMFWMDTWAGSNLKDKVAQIIGQVQTVGVEMNKGITNDPKIGVNETSRDRLVYRYGVNGNNHAILAVNIANRHTNNGIGETLTNIKFTLPSSLTSNNINVVGENRTIPVINGTFMDTFTKYAVHIYKFQSESGNGYDINTDGKINIFDYSILIKNYGKTTHIGDISGDSKVDSNDFFTFINNFIR